MKKISLNINHKKFDLFCILGLLIAALFIYLIALGNLPLRDWDEGTRALVAREIYRTGNWLHPTIYSQPYMLKPPLMMWLVSICYYLEGISEFTTRLLPSILTALGVPLLYLIGREIFERKLPAIFSALVYLTLLPVLRHGRLIMLDGMILTLFMLALFCLLKANKRRIWTLGIGLSLGLIALTKGILVLVFGLIILIFIILNKQLNIFKNIYLYLGFLLGFLPVFAWYFLQYQYYGIEFIQVHFQNQGIERVSTAVEGNKGPIWYYLIELIKYTIPWLIFFPQGLYYTWQNKRESWAILSLTCLIIYFAIISIMGTKLPWYIMPIYPFFALIIGSYLAHLWDNVKYFSKFYLGFCAFLSVASFASIIYFVLVDRQVILILMALNLSIFMGISAWKIKQNNRHFIPILILGMYLTLSLLMMSKSWIWELNEAFAVKPVGTLIKNNTPPNTKIYTSFYYSRPSLDFYSDRQVIAENITNLLQNLSNKEVYLLLDENSLVNLNVPYKILGKTDNFTLIKCQILR